MAAPMVTARRAAEIAPFEVMDVLSRAQALERAGRHVVHMEIGEPDFTAPAAAVEAGGGARGAPGGSRFGAAVPPERVVVSAGASGGLLTVAALYFEAGDEVLVPD